jgi:hypothetical protein
MLCALSLLLHYCIIIYTFTYFFQRWESDIVLLFTLFGI